MGAKKTFRPRGLSFLRFGQGVMRNYALPDESATTPSRMSTMKRRPMWATGTELPLDWKAQSNQSYDNPTTPDAPVSGQNPAVQRPVQRSPQAAPQTAPQTAPQVAPPTVPLPVPQAPRKATHAELLGFLQRYEDSENKRDEIRQQKKEMISRAFDSEGMESQNRLLKRGSLNVDYVSTSAIQEEGEAQKTQPKPTLKDEEPASDVEEDAHYFETRSPPDTTLGIDSAPTSEPNTISRQVSEPTRENQRPSSPTRAPSDFSGDVDSVDNMISRQVSEPTRENQRPSSPTESLSDFSNDADSIDNIISRQASEPTRENQRPSSPTQSPSDFPGDADSIDNMISRQVSEPTRENQRPSSPIQVPSDSSGDADSNDNIISRQVSEPTRENQRPSNPTRAPSDSSGDTDSNDNIISRQASEPTRENQRPSSPTQSPSDFSGDTDSIHNIISRQASEPTRENQRPSSPTQVPSDFSGDADSIDDIISRQASEPNRENQRPSSPTQTSSDFSGDTDSIDNIISRQASEPTRENQRPSSPTQSPSDFSGDADSIDDMISRKASKTHSASPESSPNQTQLPDSRLNPSERNPAESNAKPSAKWLSRSEDDLLSRQIEDDFAAANPIDNDEWNPSSINADIGETFSTVEDRQPSDPPSDHKASIRPASDLPHQPISRSEQIDGRVDVLGQEGWRRKGESQLFDTISDADLSETTSPDLSDSQTTHPPTNIQRDFDRSSSDTVSSEGTWTDNQAFDTYTNESDWDDFLDEPLHHESHEDPFHQQSEVDHQPAAFDTNTFGTSTLDSGQSSPSHLQRQVDEDQMDGEGEDLPFQSLLDTQSFKAFQPQEPGQQGGAEPSQPPATPQREISRSFEPPVSEPDVTPRDSDFHTDAFGQTFNEYPSDTDETYQNFASHPADVQRQVDPSPPGGQPAVQWKARRPLEPLDLSIHEDTTDTYQAETINFDDRADFVFDQTDTPDDEDRIEIEINDWERLFPTRQEDTIRRQFLQSSQEASPAPDLLEALQQEGMLDSFSATRSVSSDPDILPANPTTLSQPYTQRGPAPSIQRALSEDDQSETQVEVEVEDDIDVDDLARRVYRVIKRRLRNDRDRLS
ncbi:hypothetical protein MASR2M15_03100 [Anaerolineales bacterium]